MKDQETRVQACARAAHEANRAYCIALGDHLQVSWDDAPEEHRISMRIGARLALGGSTPEQQHESWLAEKIAAGWTYGPVKLVDAKTHPCLMPYSDLPAAQKAKDALFIAVVHAVGAALDR